MGPDTKRLFPASCAFRGIFRPAGSPGRRGAPPFPGAARPLPESTRNCVIFYRENYILYQKENFFAFSKQKPLLFLKVSGTIRAQTSATDGNRWVTTGERGPRGRWPREDADRLGSVAARYCLFLRLFGGELSVCSPVSFAYRKDGTL